MNLRQDNVLEDTNKRREIIPLLYLRANQAIFMLGMYLAPDINNKDQVELIHKKETARANPIG